MAIAGALSLVACTSLGGGGGGGGGITFPRAGSTATTTAPDGKFSLAFPGDLSLFDAHLTFRSGGQGLVRASWKAIPKAKSYDLELVGPFGVSLATVSSDGPPEGQFDPRLVEDLVGAAVLVGTVRRDGPGPGGHLDVNGQSAPSPFTGSAGKAPSLGKACTLIGPDGAPTRELCTFTAGFGPPADRAALRATSAVLDLGAPGPIGLVVAPGCNRCEILSGDDGTTFRRLEGFPALGTPLSSTSVRPVGARSRYVKVSWADTNPPSVPVNVSVWPTREASATAIGTGGAGRSLNPGLLPAAGGKGRTAQSLALVVLAILALAGVLLAAGVAIGRRRSQN